MISIEACGSRRHEIPTLVLFQIVLVSIFAQCGTLSGITVVAQLVEQRIPNPQVWGSIPSDRVRCRADGVVYLLQMIGWLGG